MKLRQSQDPRVRAALDRVYRRLFPDGTIERIEHDDAEAFQRAGMDVRVILRRPRGGTFGETIQETIEEKIRQPDSFTFRDILVEYLSNAELGTLGWAFTSSADRLCYVKQPPDRIVGLILPMQEFKSWFAARWQKYADPRSPTYTELTRGARYETRNKIIPLNDPMFGRFFQAHGCLKFEEPLIEEEVDPDDLPF